jgi:hypothetical protein
MLVSDPAVNIEEIPVVHLHLDDLGNKMKPENVFPYQRNHIVLNRN